MEAEDALEKLGEALKVCHTYENSFFQYRERLPSYFNAKNTPVLEWSFDPFLVFGRLQKFQEQLLTLQVCMYLNIYM